jgi:DnaJ-class molecular chaperone
MPKGKKQEKLICGTCGGAGYILKERRTVRGMEWVEETCTACRGTGEVNG